MQTFISIPKPCNENWDNMTPQEQGRHCAKCNIVVQDFSEMSNEEILNYLNKNTGRTCAHVSTIQLDTTPKLSEKLRKFVYAFVIVFLPFMPLTSFAQNTDTPIEQNISTKSGELKGKIIDEKGRAVPFAKIAVLNNNIQIGVSKSDFDGNYKIATLPNGEYTMRVSSVGYKIFELLNIKIKNNQSRIENFTMQKKACIMKGIVIQTRPPIVDPRNPGKQEISDQEIRDMMGGG